MPQVFYTNYCIAFVSSVHAHRVFIVFVNVLALFFLSPLPCFWRSFLPYGLRHRHQLCSRPHFSLRFFLRHRQCHHIRLILTFVFVFFFFFVILIIIVFGIIFIFALILLLVFVFVFVIIFVLVFDFVFVSLILHLFQFSTFVS